MKILAGHVIRDHVVLGGIVAIFLLPVLGSWGAFIFWLASILIDLDHYLHFIYYTRFKRWGIREMFHFSHRLFELSGRPDFLSLDIFHTLEFIFGFAAVAWTFLPSLKPVLWGLVFHTVVDFVHLTRHKCFTKRAYSLIEFWMRKKRMERSGLSPAWLYRFDSAKPEYDLLKF